MTNLADHVAGLPDESWAIWRCAGLRSAGFPADDVLALASAATAAAADDLLRCEADDASKRTALLARVRHDFEAARARGEVSATRVLGNVRRQLQAKRLPNGLNVPELEDSLLALGRSGVAAARRHFDACFTAAHTEMSRAIDDVATGSRFQEAVTWQNHTAMRTCIEPLLQSKPGLATSKRRQRQELVTSYLHRYCVKNDTIGFFGPVGWATVTDDGPLLDVEPGTHLLRSRHVYFEQWAMDAFAKHLAADKSLRPDLIVRPSPLARIEGLMVHSPLAAPLTLTPAEMLVFRSCDGNRTTRQLAEYLQLVADDSSLSPESVEAIVERLHARRLISLDYELPLDAHPERRLKERLERIGDERARQRAIDQLAQLEADRDAAIAAAGNAGALSRALVDLDEHFTSVTGTASSRSPGAMYTGRTLLYEDCQRDVTLRIGPELVASLGPPLSLVLSSARWLTYQVGLRTKALFSLVYERLARTSGSECVNFVAFYNQALHALVHDTLVAGAGDDLRNRWNALLAPASGARIAQYRSADLKADVRQIFDAPEPGWPGACYHSPDVMIAGTSLEAVNAGDRLFVLGELHMGANTLRGQLFVEQHPDAAAMLRAIDADIPGIRLAPLTPRRYSQRATRLFPVLTSPHQYLVAMTLDSVPPEGARVVVGSSLIVRPSEDSLVIESLDGSLRFNLLQSFAGVLARIVIDRFGIMPAGPRTPRVLFDDLVVARETWRFPRCALAFVDERDSAERFLSARRWRAANELPRWVFVRIPGEFKPIYVDFDSPVAVDILARRIRNGVAVPQSTASINISEMLPRHGQHWLADARGERYCCELRIIAVDQTLKRSAVWQPPHESGARAFEYS